MNITRVANWNAQRYAQEFNLSLQHRLAVEEFNETVSAEDNHVERLDGHCDQMFVALGGLWKLGMPNEDVIAALKISVDYWSTFAASDTYERLMQLIEWQLTMLGNAENETGNWVAMLIVNIAVLNSMALLSLGFTPEEVAEAFTAVCDSNDSKSIKKVSSDVKANDGDKGAFYVPPTARLTKIVEARLARSN